MTDRGFISVEYVCEIMIFHFFIDTIPTVLTSYKVLDTYCNRRKTKLSFKFVGRKTNITNTEKNVTRIFQL